MLAQARTDVAMKKRFATLAFESVKFIDCNGPHFLDRNFPFLRWWAALKMKESQCHERARITRPA
jgi:hypothetical protein